MKTAADWFTEGMGELDLSRGADSTREYHGDLERAVAAFDQAIALDRTYPGAHWERGRALATLGQHEAALDSFVEAVALKPDDADLQFAVAQSLVKLDQREAALGAYEKVLALRPGDDEALYGRAEVLTALQRDELALAAWDQVLAESDLQNLTHHGRTVRVLLGSFRLTRARFSRALVITRLGRPDATAALRAVMDSEVPGLHGAMAPLAFHDSLRALEIVRAAYRQHVHAHAGDPETWRRAGETWLAIGRTAEALEAYDVLVQMSPSSAQAWYGKAEAHAQARQFEPALAAYRQALVLWPEFTGAAARLRVVEQEAQR